MKKLILPLLAVMITISACKKSKTDDTPATPTIGAVPSTFTQKVLIEEFTGCWCGWCVDGALELENVMNAHPGKVYGASVHDGDPMELSLDAYLGGAFNVTSFPSGMVNRVPSGGSAAMSRSAWASATTSQLAQSAKAGLAISSTVSSSDVSVEVHAGFNTTLTGNYKLVVYVLENNVSGGATYSQHNYENSNSSSPYYNLGDPIVGFKHMNVIRKVLTADAGDAIDAAKLVSGGEFVKSFSFPMGTWKQTDLSIVAFVLKAGTSSTTYQVMNVQKVGVGSLKNWD